MTADTSRWFASSFVLRIWALVAALTLANLVGWHVQRRSAHDTELASVQQSSAVLTDAFAEETVQMFRQIDQALRSIRAFHAASGSVAKTEAFIDALKLGGARIENGYLVDAEGRLVVTHNAATVGRSVADRDYFQFHRRTEADVPFVSPVELGRVTGKYLFRVTRRINDAQGRFAGVSLVTVDPESIAGFYRRLMPEEGSVAALIGVRDQRVRARTPSPPENVWLRPLGSPLWRHFARSPSGSYTALGSVDGVLRHFVYRPIPEWEMVLITGVADAQVRRRTEARLQQIAWVAISSNLVLFALAGVLTYIDRQRRQMNGLLRQQQAMLDNDLVGITKLSHRNAVWENRAFARMFGYAPGELTGQSARVLYPDDEAFRAVGAAAYPVLHAGGTYRTQVQLVRKDGSPIWVDMSGAMVSPETHESMWMMLDITDMKSRHAEVEQIAFQDTLTGLPNRSLLTDRLLQAMAMASRTGTMLAVCFIDLDGFKAVNDRFGHAAGDRLLQVIGQRLQDCMRSKDTVARLGGDEFVLVLTQLHAESECQRILERVLRAVEQPVELGPGETGMVSASIGVAFCPKDGHDPDALMKRADAAMYAAKRAGKNAIRGV